MRALLICPFDTAVTEIDINNDLVSMYDALSPPGVFRVNMVEAVDGLIAKMNPGARFHDVIPVNAWVDEEGLLKPGTEQRYSMVPILRNGAGPMPLAGRVLLLGPPDEEGEPTDLDSKITAEHVFEHTYFLGNLDNARRIIRNNPRFQGAAHLTMAG